jgi:hypothetical protein
MDGPEIVFGTVKLRVMSVNTPLAVQVKYLLHPY